MPEFRIRDAVIEIPRGSCLVDTNILVSRFLERDERHQVAEEVMEFICEEVGTPLVPTAVAVETWGMLVGREKSRSSGLAFVKWLTGSDDVVVIPGWHGLVVDAELISNRMYVDLVDAILIRLAEMMTEECELSPAMVIATFDTGDFFKCFRGVTSPKLRIYNANTLELYP